MSAPQPPAWATEDDLPTTKPAVPAPWTWDDLLAVASQALFLASGGKYRGSTEGRAQFISRATCPPGGAAPWVGGAHPARGMRRGRELMVVKLPASPITDAQVFISDVELTPAAYSIKSSGLLERLDGDSWPLDGSLTVDYTAGVDPPLGGKLAAIALALELAKTSPGAAGGGTGRLANVVTSMTREGVTIAAVNLRDALTSGLTGLPEVDLWLSGVNRERLTAPASVWSPDIPQGRPVPRTPRA